MTKSGLFCCHSKRPPVRVQNPRKEHNIQYPMRIQCVSNVQCMVGSATIYCVLKMQPFVSIVPKKNVIEFWRSLYTFTRKNDLFSSQWNGSQRPFAKFGFQSATTNTMIQTVAFFQFGNCKRMVQSKRRPKSSCLATAFKHQCFFQGAWNPYPYLLFQTPSYASFVGFILAKYKTELQKHEM